jgi:hypothetical protein
MPQIVKFRRRRRLEAHRMTKTPPSLVYIEWLDSAAMHGWRAIDDIKTDATVVVVQSIGCRFAFDPTTIPKAMITTRRVMAKR